jgi:hypothetical protein
MLKKKHQLGVLIEKNAFVDDGNGVIRFPNKLTITDDSTQKNNTRYDIPTLDMSEYRGQITADHRDSIESVLGAVDGLAKMGNRVVIEGIKFAVKENALARYAYNMMRGGFLTDFSIETYGPPPDDQGVYFNAKLVGLSAVVVGNNNNAAINQIALNSIDEAKKDELDTTDLEKEYLQEFRVANSHTENKEQAMLIRVKNSRKFAVKVTYKNEAGADTETELKPGESVDVPETEADGVEKQVDEAQEPAAAPDAAPAAAPAAGDDQANAIAAAITKAIAPLAAKVDSIEKNSFNKSAQEPQFVPAANGAPSTMSASKQLESIDWRDRAAMQINAAWDALKGKDSAGFDKLHAINEFHLNQLKKDGKVRNSMTIADFGNFVISREMLTEIEGFRSNYLPLIGATSWRETLSTQMAWLKRDGDIDMQSVEFCDDDADGNLKPVSEYTANILTANLEELAAVTPVCNAATRFLAADLIADVNQGYRTDYDRKRAQLIIARLEQAVELNGNSAVYDTTTDTHALQSWLAAMGFVAEVAQNGTYIFNYSTYVQLVNRILGAGVTGPMSQIFTTGEQAQILGRPYIVVPNDLMPTLNTAQTKTIVVNGVTVTVNHAVFYADLSTFTGRTSGGLQYDLSTDAAYEVSSTVKSAFQRNELVLRGSFFRGGAIRDTDKVAGLRSNGVS